MMKRFPVATLLLLAVFAACEKAPDPEQPEEEKKETVSPVIKDITISSEKMKSSMKVTVWLPQDYDASKTYPFLYLLHGAYDDNRAWIDKGAAGKYASRYIQEGGVPMVIIMPDALMTFYIGDNFAYELYFHEELMPRMESDYHCNGKRAVAGLSMGGYGTLYYALKYPQKFTYAYAMSPATDVDGFRALIREQPDRKVFPGITLESGLTDWTIPIQDVRNCAQMIKDEGLPCELIERSGGHDWAFWPVCLEKALVKMGATFK